jgi:DNA-binding CsgD family transcriptional regulator
LLKSEPNAPANDCAGTLVAAFSQASVAVAICDANFRPIFFNAAAASLLNISEDAPAQTPATVLPWQSAGIDPDTVRAAITRQGFWRECTTIGSIDPAATPREADIEVSAFHDGDSPRLIIVAREVQPATLFTRRASDIDLINASVHLTPREREVMLGLLAGHSSKVIGKRLAISPRTVEFHRAKLMRRFGAASLVELIQRVVHNEKAVSGGRG